MRRRLALLLVPLAVVLWFARPSLPSRRPLVLHVGPRAAQVREVDLVFQRGESVARELSLHFSDGAKPEVTRAIWLAPGDYDVGVRMAYAGGEERSFTRSCSVAGEEEVEVDLR